MAKFTIIFDSPISEESFLNKLFPNPWDALATFLAFIVLLVVAFYFAYKPVKKLIQKRGDYVENKIKNAEEREASALKKEEEASKNISASKKEAIKIVEEAKATANLEKEKIHAQAKLEADKEVERAKAQIAQEIEASKDQIHREIVEVAMDASEKVLSREVNKKDNEKLIDDFIKDLDK